MGNMGDEAWARVMGSEALYLYIVHICVHISTDTNRSLGAPRSPFSSVSFAYVTSNLNLYRNIYTDTILTTPRCAKWPLSQ